MRPKNGRGYWSQIRDAMYLGDHENGCWQAVLQPCLRLMGIQTQNDTEVGFTGKNETKLYSGIVVVFRVEVVSCNDVPARLLAAGITAA